MTKLLFLKKNYFYIIIFFLLFLFLNNSFANTVTLKSAGALAFDNKNTLFVGDQKSGLVHAFELDKKILNDQSDYVFGRAQTFEGRTISYDLTKDIGELLKVPSSEIIINDIVVHKPTKQIFLSAHNSKGPEAEGFIIKLDNGNLNLVDLSFAKHTTQSIGTVSANAKLEFGQNLSSFAITDVDYYEGELFVAGVSNEEFSSKLRRFAYPFNNNYSVSSTEIWHAVHAQFETRAPIITQTITEINGEATLIAVYACTPIVTIPLSEIKDGALVRGKTVGELGFGNTPIDIINYTNLWDGSDNFLITNTNRSATQIPFNALANAEEMPNGEGVKPLFAVGGVAQYQIPLTGVLHLDTIDETYAITVRQSSVDTGVLELHSIPIPMFFDRSDHIVEMNWPNGPDPFGYNSAPKLTFN